LHVELIFKPKSLLWQREFYIKVIISQERFLNEPSKSQSIINISVAISIHSFSFFHEKIVKFHPHFCCAIFKIAFTQLTAANNNYFNASSSFTSIQVPWEFFFSFIKLEIFKITVLLAEENFFQLGWSNWNKMCKFFKFWWLFMFFNESTLQIYCSGRLH
jgi:hypothetical protein